MFSYLLVHRFFDHEASGAFNMLMYPIPVSLKEDHSLHCEISMFLEALVLQGVDFRKDPSEI